MTCNAPRPQCLNPVKSGDTWSFAFTWKDPAGAVMNLAGYTARMQVRHATSRALLAEADSVTVIAAEGQVVVRFNAATTKGVASGKHVTDLELTETATGVVQSSPTLILPVIEDQTLPVTP